MTQQAGDECSEWRSAKEPQKMVSLKTPGVGGLYYNMMVAQLLRPVVGLRIFSTRYNTTAVALRRGMP